MVIRSAIRVMAARTSSCTVMPSCAAKRAARIMRSGSSEKEASGAPGVAQDGSVQVADAAERIHELQRRAAAGPWR